MIVIRMSVIEVLKNLLYFYEEVLPKAFCSPDYDEESIANAFLWAEFCEKLYGRLDEENVKKVKKHLQDLKSAKDENLYQCTSLLCRAFLQNPNIDKNDLENILSKITPSGLNTCEVWKDAVESDSLFIKLLESLKGISFIDADRSFYHEVKSELLLDFLNDFAEQLTTEEQLETRMSLILETLCETHDGMMVLLHAFFFNAHDASEIQEFSVHWVLGKFLENKNCNLACFFWNQPPLTLRKIAVKYPTFYSYYIEYLTQLASESGAGLGKGRVMTNDAVLSYDAIVKHLKTLLSIDDAVGRATRDNLETLKSNQKESTIWTDIMSVAELS